MSMSFEVIASGFQFAEAPRVDDRGTVYFSDLTGGGYYRCRPGSPAETRRSRVDRRGGGPGLGDLYVTTGGNAADPGKGGLIRIRCDVPGLPEHRYGA